MASPMPREAPVTTATLPVRSREAGEDTLTGKNDILGAIFQGGEAMVRFPRRNIGMLLLAIYLILVGLISFGLSFPYLGTLAGLLALVAGILILIGR